MVLLGVPTSNISSGQQWDFPNAWAPLQLVLVEALLGLNSTGAQTLAMQLAQRWLSTTWCGWYVSSLKYSAVSKCVKG